MSKINHSQKYRFEEMIFINYKKILKTFPILVTLQNKKSTTTSNVVPSLKG